MGARPRKKRSHGGLLFRIAILHYETHGERAPERKEKKMTSTAATLETEKKKAARLMVEAEASLRQALAAMREAKEVYTKVAKATGRWNMPICELGDYSRNLAELLECDGGEAGFAAIVKNTVKG